MLFLCTLDILVIAWSDTIKKARLICSLHKCLIACKNFKTIAQLFLEILVISFNKYVMIICSFYECPIGCKKLTQSLNTLQGYWWFLLYLHFGHTQASPTKPNYIDIMNLQHLYMTKKSTKSLNSFLRYCT